MLRKIPFKLIIPKPLFFTSIPRFRFSENPKQDPNDPKDSNKNKKKPTWTEQITKLNTYFETKEKIISSYFTNISTKQLLLIIGAMLILGYQIRTLIYQNAEEISYNELFNNYVRSDLISKIHINKILDSSGYFYKADIQLKSGEKKVLELGNVDFFLSNLEKTQQEENRPVSQLIPIEFQHKRTWVAFYEHYYNFIYGILSLVMILGFITNLSKNPSMMKGGNNIFGIGKSTAKVFGVETMIKTRFKDVAGLDEAKVEIMEFVDFLKKPKKYKDLGVRLPRGALLSGPPGTGKTMLAKACAGEAKVPFFYMSGSDFVEMFVGVGAARVRDLFKQAKEKSPSIIFIDEIDAVGRKRENKMGGNDERDNTLNQLLVEMDGFGTDTNVVILAATNKKDLLDTALTRPGRFDRNIEISLPDLPGRRAIFLVHLKPLKLNPKTPSDEFARRLATLTPGFSGADIANLCNEAAILAARDNKSFIDSSHFEQAAERVLAGLEKKDLLSLEEKKVVAVHESGHAVVSWFLEGGAPLLKITIIPRSKGSLGYAQYLPNENSLETKEALIDRACCLLGGRCAEEMFFGKISTGAVDDLEKLTELCYIMVTKLGMNDRMGLRGFKIEDYMKNMSQETLKEVDDEVRNLIKEATERTKSILLANKQAVENLSNVLMEKESLDLKGIIEILGDRPFKPKKNFEEYLETKKLIESEEITEETIKKTE